jgi:hypothetical protein
LSATTGRALTIADLGKLHCLTPHASFVVNGATPSLAGGHA